MKLDSTPGPWYIRSTGKHWNNSELENLEICYGKDDECIADTVYEASNARLIAAAPSMIEALINEAMKYESDIGQPANWLIPIIEAATGKTWEE